MLEPILAAIEASAPVAALRSSFVTYPLVNAAHVLAIGTLIAAVVLMDLRLLGFLRSVEREAFVALLRRVALSAFALALLTGLALFSIRARDYSANPAFLAKMALLALAGMNFLAFTRLSGSSGAAPTVPARVLAALSMALWLGVLVAGRFIGFVE